MACVVSCHMMQCDVMVMSCTTPVLLCTTKVLLYHSSTTLYYKVLLQYYPVLQSTTPILLCTTKYDSSTNLYYKVLFLYYSGLQSTTPLLLRTRNTTLYYSSTTLYYSSTTKYYSSTTPVLPCTTKYCNRCDAENLALRDKCYKCSGPISEKQLAGLKGAREALQASGDSIPQRTVKPGRHKAQESRPIPSGGKQRRSCIKFSSGSSWGEGWFSRWSCRFDGSRGPRIRWQRVVLVWMAGPRSLGWMGLALWRPPRVGRSSWRSSRPGRLPRALPLWRIAWRSPRLGRLLRRPSPGLLRRSSLGLSPGRWPFRMERLGWSRRSRRRVVWSGALA